jgi:hypothetical protein
VKPQERLARARRRLRWRMAAGDVVDDVQELPEPEIGDYQARRPRPARTEREEEELRELVSGERVVRPEEVEE